MRKTTPDSLKNKFFELVKIIEKLRQPGGCPWDREQDHQSLKPYLVEETYEVIDAIDKKNPVELKEELGDLLLQIILHAQIAMENNDFSIEDVLSNITHKLVFRHPHVFGDTNVTKTSEVLSNWEKLKKKEKSRAGLFDGIPRHMPALHRASRMGEKACRVGFDWKDEKGVKEKLFEEINELKEAVVLGNKESITHEMGDVLFAAAQWSRHLDVHPEEALKKCCKRFSSRFGIMEKKSMEKNTPIDKMSSDELEELWQWAKKQ